VTHDELVAELTRRYPDRAMPAGAGIALAHEVGADIGAVADARGAAGIMIEPRPIRPYYRRRRVPSEGVASARPRPPSNVPEVLAELERRCHENKCVEPGSFRSIAELLGVSPGWVGKVANAHGYVVTRRSWRSALKTGKVLP
jgi:hypothetical protein